MLNIDFFKAVLDSEPSSVVVCDLNDTIVYMNPFAVKKYGKDLTGKNLLDCHNENSRMLIKKTVEWFKKSSDNNSVYEFHNEKENRDVYIIALRDEQKNLIGYWEKHIYRNAETASFFDFS